MMHDRSISEDGDYYQFDGDKWSLETPPNTDSNEAMKLHHSMQ